MPIGPPHFGRRGGGGGGGGNSARGIGVCTSLNQTEVIPMRGMLLWMIGIPLPIIILLYLFGVM